MSFFVAWHLEAPYWMAEGGGEAEFDLAIGFQSMPVMSRDVAASLPRHLS
jgi:hypothetical protein